MTEKAKTKGAAAIAITCVSAVFAVAVWMLSQFPALVIYEIIPIPLIGRVVDMVVQIAVVYFALAIYARFVEKRSMRECRIDRLQLRPVWFGAGIALAGCMAVFYLLAVPTVTTVNPINAERLLALLIAAMSCITAATTEEMVFRGFMMKSIGSRWGKWPSMIIPSLLFGALHIINGGTLGAVDILLLVVAGTSVGIMFSVITYKTGHIWPAVTVHAIWNLRNSIVRIAMTDSESVLVSCRLDTGSLWLTGGNWGVESALIAVVLYWVVTVLILPRVKWEEL